MRKDEFSDIFGEIDDKYVEEAHSKKPLWIKWGTIAACFCFIVGVALAYQSGLLQMLFDSDIQAVGAYGFCINDDNRCVYFKFDYNEREQYGFLRDSDITSEDIGEPMGVVTKCTDRSLIGCKVYHFAKYPEKDAICIVETPEGYAPYACDWIDIEVEIGEKFDKKLSVYELPESLESMELLIYDEEGITGEKYIRESIIDIKESIIEILSGKTNIGNEATGRRLAKIWYDAYGNDDVYYSEKEGRCVVRLEGVDEANQNDKARELWDKAHELWDKDERLIEITTNAGFKLQIDYFPVRAYFVSGNAKYDLSDADVKALNQLLQIGE